MYNSYFLIVNCGYKLKWTFCCCSVSF